jgi:hypothetical protein
MFAGIVGLISALAPLAESLLSGASVEGALSSLTLADWLSLTGGMVAMDPALLKGAEGELIKLFQAVAPHVVSIMDKVQKYGAEEAAKLMLAEQLRKNDEAAIAIQDQGIKDH